MISSLADSASQVVTITFNTTATAGTATAKLIATTTNTDTGSYNIVSVAAAGAAPIVTLEPVARFDRSDCVTAGAGPAGAYQCGDLLLAHAMPAYRTLNENRQLTLLYNSAAATAMHTLPVVVKVPTGTPAPDSLRAVMQIGSQQWTFRYTGSSFTSGAKKRLSLSFDASLHPAGTGLYAFTLGVFSYYGATAHATVTNGELVLVDRNRVADSPYGIGWSVAGLSRLYRGQSGRDALVIVEADGSFSTYDPIAANTYRAARGAFRDTVFYGHFDPGTGVADTFFLRRDIDQTSSYYDRYGRLRWITDKRPQRTEYTYAEPTNPSSRLASVIVAPRERNRTYVFGYTSGYLDSISDPAGRTLNVTVDGSGRVTQFLDPGLTQPIVLGYFNFLLTSWKSPLNHTFTYAYNNNRDYLVSTTMPDGGVMQYVPATLNGYAIPGNAIAAAAGANQVRTQIVGPRADVTTFDLNQWGAPSKIINALGDTTYLERIQPSVPFLVTRVLWPDKTERLIEYNGRGSILKITEPGADTLGADSLKMLTEYVYGSSNNRALPTVVRRLGTGYNDSTVSVINTQGLLQNVTDSRGLVTRFVYSDTVPGMLGRVLQDSVWTYIPSSNTKVKRRLITRLYYDTLGNLIGHQNPLGSVVTYRKDAVGRDTAFINEVGNRRSFSYSPFNHLLTYTSHGMPSDSVNMSLTTTNAYNQHVLQSVTDPRGIPVRSYTRDGFDRIVKEIDDFSKHDSTTYDLAGNASSFKARMFEGTSKAVTMRFDQLNRLEARKWPAHNALTGDSAVFYFDKMGRSDSIKSATDAILRTYYPNGFLKKETQRHGANQSTHEYRYDRFGRRTAYVIGASQRDSIKYSYSPDNMRMTIHVWWRTVATADSVVLKFDQLGRRDSVLYFVTGQQPTKVGYAYDHAGVLRSICAKHLDSSSGYNDQLNFRWLAEDVDSAGRPRTINATSASYCTASPDVEFFRTNKYDGHGRLITQRTHVNTELRYDSSSNLIRKYTTYLNGDPHRRFEYTMMPGHNRLAYFTTQYRNRVVKHLNVHYDSSGNRSAEIPGGSFPDSAFFQTRGFSYDGLGRTRGSLHYELKQTLSTFWSNHYEELLSSAQAIGSVKWSSTDSIHLTFADTINQPNSCKYDPLGRMWQPCENGAPFVVFDGYNVVRTGDDRPNSELSRFTFVHGPGLDDPLLSRKENETLVYVTNGTGEYFIIARADGFPTSRRVHSDNPGYAGGIKNAGSFDNQSAGALGIGLSYFRNRFYDAETGRWTQEDPLGAAAGTNLYAYVRNDPTTSTDPFGLCEYPGDPDCGKWIAAGTLIGGGIGSVVASGCTATTGGVCVAGAPAIIGAGASLGSAVGGLIGTLGQARVGTAAMSKVTDWLKVIRNGVLLGAGILSGDNPRKRPDEVEQDPTEIVEPAPKPGERPPEKDKTGN